MLVEEDRRLLRIHEDPNSSKEQFMVVLNKVGHTFEVLNSFFVSNEYVYTHTCNDIEKYFILRRLFIT